MYGKMVFGIVLLFFGIVLLFTPLFNSLIIPSTDDITLSEARGIYKNTTDSDGGTLVKIGIIKTSYYLSFILVIIGILLILSPFIFRKQKVKDK